MNTLSKLSISAPFLIALTAGQTLAQTEATDPERAIVSVEEAVALLDAVCTPTRPRFKGAEQRMLKSGLTDVGKDGTHASPVKVLSAETGKLRTGKRTCAVSSAYRGKPAALKKELTKLFGKPAVLGAKNSADAPPISVFDRGPKGKVLLLRDPGHRRSRFVIYDLGYVEGL